MIYVGIDAAKNKNDCYIVNSEGELLCDNLTFANSLEGYDAFLNLVKNCCNNDLSNVKVGIESTGHYSTNLITFLNQTKLYVVVFNPMIINRKHKADSLRKTKTDKSDAKFIAESLFFNKSDSYHLESYHIQELKSLTRARQDLAHMKQPLQNKYRKCIQLVFPEITTLFSSCYGSSIFAVLKELPSAQDVASCNILKLTKILKDNSHGKLGREFADQLKDLASHSIAAYYPGESFNLKLLISRIEFIDSQLEILEAKIKELLDAFNSPITTIPGIGTILGASILADIGDISKFETSSQLQAFAGCEPSTYQSGEYIGTHEHMVKHGSKYLRTALYQAVIASNIKGNNVFSNVLHKKVSEGKHFYVAVTHAMKKLIRVIFAMLTTNQPFKTEII